MTDFNLIPILSNRISSEICYKLGPGIDKKSNEFIVNLEKKWSQIIWK